MKSLKSIKREVEFLNSKSMSSITGGNQEVACGCACAYENNGGSSTMDNAYANSADGKYSTEIYKVIIRTNGKVVDMR